MAGLWPRSGPGLGSEAPPDAPLAQTLPGESAPVGGDASRVCSAISTTGEAANPEGRGTAGGMEPRAAMQDIQPGGPPPAANVATAARPDCGRPSAEGLLATGLHVRECGDAAVAEPHAALAASAGKGPRPWDPLAELAAARGEQARATLKWLMAALPEGCDMSYGQARARQQPCMC